MPDHAPGEREADDAPETTGERRLSNLLILGFVLFVIAAGFWLGNAIMEARRADECMSAGLRNCSPVAPKTVPQR
jgi:hypothetical protein